MLTVADSNNDGGVTTEHADRSHEQMLSELNADGEKNSADVE